MAKPTEHTITADLPRYLGSGEDADVAYFKADVTFSYQPPWEADATDPGAPAELELLKVVPVAPDIYLHLSHKEVRAIADDWLQEEGYDMACQHAEDQRHGDWE